MGQLLSGAKQLTREGQPGLLWRGYQVDRKFQGSHAVESHHRGRSPLWVTTCPPHTETFTELGLALSCNPHPHRHTDMGLVAAPIFRERMQTLRL